MIATAADVYPASGTTNQRYRSRGRQGHVGSLARATRPGDADRHARVGARSALERCSATPGEVEGQVGVVVERTDRHAACSPCAAGDLQAASADIEQGRSAYA